VCRKECDGTFLPASPVIVVAQLPDNDLAKKTALDYIKRFEVQYGPGTVTAFGSYAWNVGLLI